MANIYRHGDALALSNNGLYCALPNPKYSVIEIIALDALKLLLQIPIKGVIKSCKFSPDSQVSDYSALQSYN